MFVLQTNAAIKQKNIPSLALNLFTSPKYRVRTLSMAYMTHNKHHKSGILIQKVWKYIKSVLLYD